MFSLFLPQAAAPEAEKAQADVYAFEPQPLEEGVRKHMLSVFVADESGLINRVAVRQLAMALAMGMAMVMACITRLQNGPFMAGL